MPTKEISTKCNVFLQLVTLRPHQHSTHLKIRRSADAHFTGGLLRLSDILLNTTCLDFTTSSATNTKVAVTDTY